jgi:hypothetical protein
MAEWQDGWPLLEEHLAAELVYGAVLATQGSYGPAAARLRRVLELAATPAVCEFAPQAAKRALPPACVPNVLLTGHKTQAAGVADPYHAAFARLELAVLMLQHGAYRAALDGLDELQREKATHSCAQPRPPRPAPPRPAPRPRVAGPRDCLRVVPA